MNRCFSKEDIPVVNKHMERCSASSVIREMEMKAINHFTPTRIDRIRKTGKSEYR